MRYMTELGSLQHPACRRLHLLCFSAILSHPHHVSCSCRAIGDKELFLLKEKNVKIKAEAQREMRI